AACGAEPELLDLARDCLAAEPAGRPRDAGVVAARMTAYLAGVQDRLRKAELARVEAQPKAAEERKRRKLTGGLAASMLALVTLGGGVAAWSAQQRAERHERIRGLLLAADAALDRAERAPDVAAAAPEEERARLALGQAGALAAGGTVPADAERLVALRQR